MKNILYLFLAVTIFACSSDSSSSSSNSSSSVEGTYTGTFNIPAGPYTPNGDSGSFTVSTSSAFDDFYTLEGTITTTIFGTDNINGSYIELDENNQLVISFTALGLGDEWPNVEVYSFDGIIVNGQITNGLVTTAHTSDGSFTGSKQ
jgi:hypothetical protein